MTPCVSSYDMDNGRPRNRKAGSNLFSCVSFGSHLTNQTNIIFGQFCIWNFLAFLLPTLSRFVFHVVRNCTEKQVVRVDAPRIITFMQDLKIIENKATVKEVRQAVRPHSSFLPYPLRRAISFIVQRPIPRPARVSLAWDNVIPESVFRRKKLSESDPVSDDEFLRLAPDPSLLRVGLWAKIGFLTTPTVAVSVGDFLRGFVRSIISHVDSLLVTFGQTVGRFSVATVIVLEVNYTIVQE